MTNKQRSKKYDDVTIQTIKTQKIRQKINKRKLKPATRQDLISNSQKKKIIGSVKICTNKKKPNRNFTAWWSWRRGALKNTTPIFVHIYPQHNTLCSHLEVEQLRRAGLFAHLVDLTKKCQHLPSTSLRVFVTRALCLKITQKSRATKQSD